MELSSVSTAPSPEVEQSHLYETVAARVANMIVTGVYRAGDRLPSIRELSGQLQVSVNTVMAAYTQLENRQVIEARPRSGYFVRTRIAEPAQHRSAIGGRTDELVARPVTIPEATAMVMRTLETPSLVPLGVSAPNIALLPADRLNRMLATEARRHRLESIGYAAAAGNIRLRRQIAKRLVTAGCTVTPDDIIITSGCVEAVTLALQAVCRPGQTVAVASPVYWTFLSSIQWLGLNILEIPSCPQDGISLDVLAYAMRNQAIAACVLISNFNNPLGSVIPEANKEKLAALCAKHQVPLIEDDVYGDLAFSPPRPPSLKAFDVGGWVIQCSSFSKTLAPGYRVGWMVPGRFRSQIQTLKRLFNIATASPTQLAVAEFLANGGYDRHLRKLRRIYCEQMTRLRNAVGLYFPVGTRASRPEGGTVLWVEMPPTVDAYGLYEQALARNIGIAPGPLFTMGEDYRHCIRLNAAVSTEREDEAVRVVGALAAKLAGE